jgi:hypothetical protein
MNSRSPCTSPSKLCFVGSMAWILARFDFMMGWPIARGLT